MAADDNSGEAMTQLPADKPSITSFQDLHALSELFNQVDGSFSHCTFSSFGHDYAVYFGRTRKKKLELTLEYMSDNLKRIPDYEIYPKAPSSIKSYPYTIGEDVYLKLPNLSRYEDLAGTDLMAKLCLDEAEIFQRLEQHPHPNIAKYHGSVIKRGRSVGIVLERYHISLSERILDEKPKHFHLDACIQRIESGIKHLHSLGLAHNDLNPNNIMLDRFDVPYLIDLGSCRPFGHDLVTAGTVGWVDENFTKSAREHDEVALQKLKAWIEKKQSEYLSPHVEIRPN